MAEGGPGWWGWAGLVEGWGALVGGWWAVQELAELYKHYPNDARLLGGECDRNLAMKSDVPVVRQQGYFTC